MWSRALVELQESLRIARAIGRHGVIDDVAELGVERLLLSDPDLAATIIERELGALLADPRMGEELVETLQVYVDAGGNRRETARRLHLADRTVAYRLERAEAAARPWLRRRTGAADECRPDAAPAGEGTAGHASLTPAQPEPTASRRKPPKAAARPSIASMTQRSASRIARSDR